MIPKFVDLEIEANPKAGVITRSILGGLHHDDRRAACNAKNIRTASVAITAYCWRQH